MHTSYNILSTDRALVHLFTTGGTGHHVAALQQDTVYGCVHADSTEIVLCRCQISSWGRDKKAKFLSRCHDVSVTQQQKNKDLRLWNNFCEDLEYIHVNEQWKTDWDVSKEQDQKERKRDNSTNFTFLTLCQIQSQMATWIICLNYCHELSVTQRLVARVIPCKFLWCCVKETH